MDQVHTVRIGPTPAQHYDRSQPGVLICQTYGGLARTMAVVALTREDTAAVPDGFTYI